MDTDLYNEFKMLLKIQANNKVLSNKPDANYRKMLNKMGITICNLCGVRTKEFYKSRPNECKKCSNLRHYKYVEENKDKVYKYFYKKQWEYNKVKRKKDPVYLYVSNFRSKFRNYWVGRSNQTKVITDLGTSMIDFRSYIENLFLKGMTWDNYGNGRERWTLDHKIPTSSAKTINDAKKLLHYTNVQPMWYIDNIKKGNK